MPLQAPRWAGGTGVWAEVSVSDVCSGINLGALLLIKRARGHIGSQVHLLTYSSLVPCFYCHGTITSATAAHSLRFSVFAAHGAALLRFALAVFLC